MMGRNSLPGQYIAIVMVFGVRKAERERFFLPVLFLIAFRVERLIF
jgi:hypothetical protein